MRASIPAMRAVTRFVFMIVVPLATCAMGSLALAQDPSTVWILEVDTEITPATAQYVERRIERANDAGALAVLLRIDTPGGRVDSMTRIVDTILNDARVPVLALVENAFSAGALIAMSADQVAIVPGASIGAALPITVGLGGANEAGEKATSALRGQFRSVAEARGRDPAVAEAMVDPNREIPGVSARGELLTLSAEEAVELGIADLLARDLGDALEQFGYAGARTSTVPMSVTERWATWLASPIVAGLLLALGIGGLVLEFFSPGFGIPGAIGILALAAFGAGAVFAAPVSAVDGLLIVAGLALLVAEAFLVPGFGVAGILGTASLIAAVVRIFEEDAVTVLSSFSIVAGVLLGVLLWMVPRTGLGRWLTLNARIGGGQIAAAAASRSATVSGGATYDPAQAALVGDRSALVHARGTATSDLRPGGIATFSGERVDVVSEGDYLPRGTDVVVVRVEGNHVVVRPVAGDRSPSEPVNARPNESVETTDRARIEESSW